MLGDLMTDSKAPRDEKFRELVGIAVGEASTLFHGKDGVFDTRRANKIADRICEAFEQMKRERDDFKRGFELMKLSNNEFRAKVEQLEKGAIPSHERMNNHLREAIEDLEKQLTAERAKSQRLVEALDNCCAQIERPLSMHDACAKLAKIEDIAHAAIAAHGAGRNPKLGKYEPKVGTKLK